MTNGNGKNWVIVFDAMNTIFQARGGRRKLILHVFEEEIGQKISGKKIKILSKKAEKIFGKLKDDYRKEWAYKNAYIVKELLKSEEPVESFLSQGERIHKRILSDTSLYEVPKDLFNAFVAFNNLKNSPVLAIASNQYEVYLEKFVDEFNLRSFFKGRVLSSDRLGTSKPDSNFLKKVLDILEADPVKTILVGNSVKRDWPIAQSHPVKFILYPPPENLFLAENSENFFSARNAWHIFSIFCSFTLEGWRK